MTTDLICACFQTTSSALSSTVATNAALLFLCFPGIDTCKLKTRMLDSCRTSVRRSPLSCRWNTARNFVSRVPPQAVDAVNSPNRSLEEGPLAEFELVLVDFRGLDPRLEGRWWNSKLSRRSGWSGNPASGLSERRLDHLPFASRLNIQSRRCFSPRCLRRSAFRKPQLIN